ncbi:hypothetical protein ACOSP7_028301 [Xanthoceras sorbifolium]
MISYTYMFFTKCWDVKSEVYFRQRTTSHYHNKVKHFHTSTLCHFSDEKRNKKYAAHDIQERRNCIKTARQVKVKISKEQFSAPKVKRAWRPSLTRSNSRLQN